MAWWQWLVGWFGVSIILGPLVGRYLRRGIGRPMDGETA